MSETTNSKQQVTIVTYHDDWNGKYRAIGPFASKETATRWLNEHKPPVSSPKTFYQIVPITPSSKVDGLF